MTIAIWNRATQLHDRFEERRPKQPN